MTAAERELVLEAIGLEPHSHGITNFGVVGPVWVVTAEERDTILRLLGLLDDALPSVVAP